MSGLPQAQPPDRAGERVRGKYDLLERIAVGGMGEVYRARNAMIGREVALKILLPDLAQHKEIRERFLREAKLAHFVRHAHVVEMLDIDEDGAGIPFIVQEFLEGEDLASYLESFGTMPVDLALAVMHPVAEAAGAAHAKGVVHRDLKPENIFLHRTDDVIVPKILDFGISKAHSDKTDLTTTRSNRIMGSPTYMSPEQIQQPESVDEATDVWALGIILYEALTGYRPFDADSVNQLFVRICRDDPMPIRDVAPNLPRGLPELIHDCLQRERRNRPANGAEVAERLGRIKSGLSGVLEMVSQPMPREEDATPFDMFSDAVGVRASALTERPPPRERQREPTQHSEWGAWELPDELQLDIEAAGMAGIGMLPETGGLHDSGSRPLDDGGGRRSRVGSEFDLDNPSTFESDIGLDIDESAHPARTSFAGSGVPSGSHPVLDSRPPPAGASTSGSYGAPTTGSYPAYADAKSKAPKGTSGPYTGSHSRASLHVEPILPTATNMMLTFLLMGSLAWLVPSLSADQLPSFTRQLGPFLYLGAFAVVAALGVVGASIMQRARDDGSLSMTLSGAALLLLTVTIFLDALRHLLPNIPGVRGMQGVVGVLGMVGVALVALGFGAKAFSAFWEARRLSVPQPRLRGFFFLSGLLGLALAGAFGYLCWTRVAVMLA